MLITAFEQEFDLVNPEKIQRSIDGVKYTNKGITTKTGGLPEGYTPEQLIVEYDKLGGLIRKNGTKVVNGSFYDIEKRQAKTLPEIKFVAQVEGEQVEVSEEEAQSIMKAQEKLKEIKAKKVKKLKKLQE